MSTISSPPPLPVSPPPSDMSISSDREKENERERPQISQSQILGRPLSEISENESNRRSNRSSVHSRKEKDKDKGELKEKSSRPASEVKDDLAITSIITLATATSPTAVASTSTSPMTRRISSSMPVQTITVNLIEYGKAQPPLPPSPAPSSSSIPIAAQPLALPPKSSATPSTRQLPNGLSVERPKSDLEEEGPPPPSPSTKPPELPKRPDGSRTISLGSEKLREEKDLPRPGENDLPKPFKGVPARAEQVAESSKGGVSSFLLAKRASLRPSPLGGSSYADVAKPIPSPPLSSDSHTSLNSSRSSSDFTKPPTKAKPSWLRRASGTAALRSKSKSPAPKEDGSTLPASTSLPPTLPPRKGLNGETINSGSTSLSIEETDEVTLPPKLPKRGSYATILASTSVAGPSRSRLADGQGRPAFSPPTTSSSTFPQPPPLPSRDNVGNIRGRLAAWTAAAQSANSSFSRSESSNSIASQAGSSFGYPQRFPASAQRVLGHAGSAVSKGWAGLRARGVGGSISSMGALGQPSSRQNPMGPSNSWGSGMARRGSRDRSQSDNHDLRPNGKGTDGPVFAEGVFRRQAQGVSGKVFGRDVGEAGKEWGIANDEMQGESSLSEMERRRRKCLPAVVIRAIEYIVIWGPKEEGIFRISGRSSHIARLRKEFDAGADIDLTQCHPGDLDPHAVAGLFKSYLRELPAPLLTNNLAPKFDAYVKGKSKSPVAGQRATFEPSRVHNGDDVQQEDLPGLLQQLPQAQWFLLADIVKLLDLIPRHAHTNRMTLNALMLSLGPSLNISGGVLNELLDRQDELFAEAPSPSGVETANDLIDFGDTSIPAVEPPTASTTTSSNWPSDEQAALAVPASGTPKKKSPRLPPKPSLTKLFGSSHTTLPRQKSVDTLHSISTIEPPRVEIAMSPTSPLPTFETESSSQEGGQGSTIVEEAEKLSTAAAPLSTMPPIEAISSQKPTDVIAASVPIPETPVPADIEQLEDVHYSPGTVEERAKIFSTPIADKFSGTSSPFPSLRARAPRSSDGSVSSAGDRADGVPNGNCTSANPATVIRRGPPVFFQSAGTAAERHGHGRSASASSQSVPTVTTHGTKRKEDGVDENGMNEDGDGRAKRLSAGPTIDMTI